MSKNKPQQPQPERFDEEQSTEVIWEPCRTCNPNPNTSGCEVCGDKKLVIREVHEFRLVRARTSPRQQPQRSGPPFNPPKFEKGKPDLKKS